MRGSHAPRRLTLAPPQLPAVVRRVAERLRASGEQALLAGGVVRDHLLGRVAKDFDIATSAPPERVAQLFERVVLVGAHFGVARVVESDGEVEVVRFRADLEYRDGRHPVGVRYTSAEEDARRRDFTINGLFYDLEAGCVIDWVGGIADLRARRLRAIGAARARYREDRLRMMRAVRFATVLGFEMETSTWDAILEEAPGIGVVSGERIRDELEKILIHPRRELGFFLLSDSGLMAQILPEVEAMRGVAQPAEFHPEGDVHRHTALVLAQMESPSFVETLGALLHDIGKPPPATFTDRIRFNNHDKVGAEMAEAIAERLRLSREEREQVVYLVRRHMVFMGIDDMRVATRKRLFAEPGFERLLRLCRADCLASHGDTGIWSEASARYDEFRREGPPRAPILRGRDLIPLGIEPGPRMGEILREAEDARLEGVFADLEGALEWVKANCLGGST